MVYASTFTYFPETIYELVGSGESDGEIEAMHKMEARHRIPRGGADPGRSGTDRNRFHRQGKHPHRWFRICLLSRRSTLPDSAL
ncbi:hypothetical protein Ssi02_73570 [Sinosporangium siamense]|uniref:Uncharacterized protein n=1 Tax=Sinosporangium siamense TaxID=1367973 RepID=A0A919VB29_9ACTN|nr:hypothetical protein Ssi02_73570 [Sinosporangium siamense]